MIVTSALPDADEDKPYATTLSTSGGQLPITWSLQSGGLPTGLSLSSGGTITGTPTVEGGTSFTVRAVDAGNRSVTQDFYLRVRNAPFQITTSSLPRATQGAPYSADVQAAGGEGDLDWHLLPGWSLPAGLAIAADGQISGTPESVGTETFGVEVIDSIQGATSTMVSITIDPAAQPTFLDVGLPAGQVGVGYAYVVRAVGGTSTYAWSTTGGSLPAGLTLNPSSGLVSGSPTTTGSGQVTIRVQDGTGGSSRALAWEVTSATDWAQEAHDPGSSSSAPGERTMTPGNVAAAGLEWRMPEENSSDVVVGGVLYSGGQVPGSFAHGITARDLGSGEVLWTRALPGPGSGDRCDRMAVTGAVVLCQAPYEVMAVSLTGSHPILWRTSDTDVGTVDYGELVVVGDTAIVIAGSSVTALGLGDGALRWSRFVAGVRTVSVSGTRVLTTDEGGEIRTFALSTGAPGWVATDAANARDPVIAVPGRNEVVALHAGTVSWRSAETGLVLRSWASQRGSRGALAADADRVYVPTGRFDEFGSIVGAGVAAVRHSDAAEVWHHSTYLGASIGVAVAGDLLWVQGSGEMDESAPSNLFALRPTTGEQRHLIRVPGPASRSPLVAGGRVIAHGGGTYVYGLMAAPVHLPPQVLPTAWATRTYSASLTAPTTGRPPYTWSLPGGSLPAGLTLTPQGALSGTPSVPGLATFTLRVVDSRGMAAQRVTRIAVRASAPPSGGPSVAVPVAAVLRWPRAPSTRRLSEDSRSGSPLPSSTAMAALPVTRPRSRWWWGAGSTDSGGTARCGPGRPRPPSTPALSRPPWHLPTTRGTSARRRSPGHRATGRCTR